MTFNHLICAWKRTADGTSFYNPIPTPNPKDPLYMRQNTKKCIYILYGNMQIYMLYIYI